MKILGKKQDTGTRKIKEVPIGFLVEWAGVYGIVCEEEYRKGHFDLIPLVDLETGKIHMVFEDSPVNIISGEITIKEEKE